MSSRLQGLTLGAITGGALYLSTYKDFWTAFEGVSQDITKIHLTINPNAKPVVVVKEEHPGWMGAYTELNNEAKNRSPTQSWNTNVREVYRYIAEMLY